MVVIMVILLIGCLVRNDRIHDKPILAFDDIIYKEFRDEQCPKSQQGKELQTISKYLAKLEHSKGSHGSSGNESISKPHHISSKSPSDNIDLIDENQQDRAANTCILYMLLSFNLWKIYLKNDHTVLSVVGRTGGTNFTGKQRVACFALYLYGVIMATAIFYGTPDRQQGGDIVASFLISLIATIPVFIYRFCFVYSKPSLVGSSYSVPLVDTSSGVSDQDGVEMTNRNHVRGQKSTIDEMAVDSEIIDKTTTITAAPEDNRSTMGVLGEMDLQQSIRSIRTDTQGSNESDEKLKQKQKMDKIWSESERDEDDEKEVEYVTPGGPDTADTDQGEDQEDEEEKEVYERLPKETIDENAQIIPLRTEEKEQQIIPNDYNQVHRLTLSYYKAVEEIKKAKGYDELRPHKLRNLAVRAKSAKNLDKQVELANELRMKLFEYQYPCPHYCNKVGWLLITTSILVFAFIGLVYGINFDVEFYYRRMNDNVEFEATTEQCQSDDLIYQLKNDLFQAEIERQIEENSVYVPGGFQSDTQAKDFLFSLVVSFLLSIFLWQPLNIYIFTLIKILSFMNGLTYSAKPQNLIAICKKQCCNKKKNRKSKMDVFALKDNSKTSLDLSGDSGNNNNVSGDNISSHDLDYTEIEFSESKSRSNSTFSDFVGDRPFDLLSFLAADELFVEKQQSK